MIRLAERYRLEEVIGTGGSATVYRAIDEVLGVERAVKLLHVDAGPEMADRLRSEARALARVAHPHVLRVYDIVHADARDFIVMELVPGGSLQDELDMRGPLAVARACELTLQVLGALEAAHAVGVIHRDVKPHNVLLDAEGRALLADFGIARIAEDTRSTRTNVAMGSLAYMAPEQRLDARNIGPTADIYALGATLYALLTAASPMDLFAAPRRSPRWSDIPAPLQTLLQRATRHDPEERQPDMATFRAELLAARRALGGGEEPVAGSPESSTGALEGLGSHAEPARPRESVRDPATAPRRSGPDDATVLDAPPVVPAPPARPRVAIPIALGGVALLGVAALWWAFPLPAEESTSRASAGPPSASPSPSLAGSPVVAAQSVPPAPDPAAREVVVSEGDARMADASPAGRRTPRASPEAPPAAPLARAWSGSFAGRSATLALDGDNGALRGTWTVRFGDNAVESAVAGRWSDGVLTLEDTEDGPDAGRYVARLADGALDGRFEGRANGRTVSFRLRAAE